MALMSTQGLAAGLLLFLLLISQPIFPVHALEPASSPSKWLKWAPYRPGLYFGVRPNIPETLLMGVMWANGSSRDSLLSTLRDTCEQDDGMKGYGWTVYDPRVGGSQIIHDAPLGVNLMTEFVKNDDGSGWAVRVSGEVRPDIDADAVDTSLIFHLAIEGAVGSAVKAKPLRCERLDGGAVGHISGTECRGKDDRLGAFVVRVNADPKTNVIKKSTIRSKRVREDKIWQAKSVYTDLMKLDNGKDAPGPGNMHFLRYDFEGSFSATFSYRDEAGLHSSPDAVTGKLSNLRSSFTSQVNKVFPRTAPFRDNRHATFSEALLSNLLGGLGFFHGDSKVSHTTQTEGSDLDSLVGDRMGIADTKVTTTKSSSLLSFTPSRPFFPRGFLWDEGFHLLPVIEWDIDLAITVLRSWLKQMDKDGWIAREQILGPEARSRVPDQFHVQFPQHVNPPTLIALVLPALLAKLNGETPYHGYPSRYITSSAERTALLQKLFPLLSQHYFYFRTSQAGNFSTYTPTSTAGAGAVIPGEGYRWRGRTPQHTLPSGLDDYPRPEPPSPGELHADALAWVGASAMALLRAAEQLGRADEAEVFRAHVDGALHNLDVLHWDPAAKVYCDATTTAPPTGGAGTSAAEYARVCHVGYASVLPALLGLLNASHPRLPAVLDALSDPATLWSEHGLRSLSAGDALYGTGEDYWRGKVWVPLNALAVLRLRAIGLEGARAHAAPYEAAPAAVTAVQGRALALAAELRRRVVGTVYKSWAKTGFAWEQYDDVTGEGKRTRAFTGWTACVLLLIGLEFKRAGWDEAGPAGGAGPVEGGGHGRLDAAGQAAAAAGKKAASMLSSSPLNIISEQTVFVVGVAIVGLLLYRRRLVRHIGRIAGYWRSQVGTGTGQYEEVVNFHARED